mmetsp:Transcript_42836/g.99188  ORF Transcript_42836/g.99188 Transcript_42836/m.99188 type:complete len:295 (-) Transcript_42836:116-1000(-)|eukprot:CAMPEP_0171097312 /NCGR_PEP_ID=MMETSP0766_2-20121228/47471_1 /TAXON_ID=439317 /ORGANISM="Gambierdiscus australes, Strain CAWD 149" /LENGTH=294 /DNA_ID=CAMNT_0011556489 /DNA_START=34 /DNA_END=918 /DNA_ORIENTATION=+
MESALKYLGGAVAGIAACELARRALPQLQAQPSRRVLVAVSGTIQDGFELRKNIDYVVEGEPTVKAVFVGYGVVRGVKMYFDVKDEGCREYDLKVPHRVNPAMVLTGQWADANQYALYLVDERSCLNALLGEPRLLTMAPDAVRLELDDPSTSPEVASLARAIIAHDGKSEVRNCAVLAVVPCYKAKHFVPAPPMEIRVDGTRLTSFRASLAAFAALPFDAEPGSAKWNGAVADTLAKHRQEVASGKGKSCEGSVTLDDSLYGTSPGCARLSRRMTVAEFNARAEEAGIALRVS